MRITSRIRCILCVLLSILLVGILEAYAASISVSVSLSGHSCRYTVKNSDVYTVWAQLEDDSGNIVVDYVESASKTGVTLTPPGNGKYRYVITVRDDATGNQAYGYSGYFTVEECVHSSTKKDNVVETYKAISATEHRYKVVYDLRCKDCGIIVLENLHDEWEEEHDFQDGVCFYCDYAQEACRHENRNTEYDEPEYVNTNDEDYHSIVTTYKVFCADCGAVVDWGKEEDFEFHKYDHDGLCFCGYYNEHYCPHDNTERRDAGYAYGVDDSINDVQHFVEHFFEEYCFDCEQVIGHGGDDSGEHNPWWEGYWEDHVFAADGYCVCGYYRKPECRHTRITEEFSGNSYTPHEVDPELHWEVPEYKITCLDCGYVRYETWPGISYPHEFDENGKCVCGYYQKPEGCTHENTEMRLGDVSYSMDEFDAEQHWVQYTYDIYCLDCSFVISDTWEGWGEAHTFDKNGRCNACGFQKKPEEIPSELQVSLSAWSSNAVINTTIGATAQLSGGSGSYSYHWSAFSVQGKHVQSSVQKNAWAITPTTPDTWHFSITIQDLVTGETVTANSGPIQVTAACLHNGKLLDYGMTNVQTEYRFDVDGDILRHLVIYHETPFLTCSICKAELPGDEQISLQRKEIHVFDPMTNKCICGASRIENFNSRLKNRLREMVEENWDPYDKWTWTYEHWDDLLHNYSLYVSDRVFGLEFAQIAADVAAQVWALAEYQSQKHYVLSATPVQMLGLEEREAYESAVEKIRTKVANESLYLYAGITTEQVGVVADIVNKSIAYAQQAASKEYEQIGDEWLGVFDAIDDFGDDEAVGTIADTVNMFISKYMNMPELRDQFPDSLQDKIITLITHREVIEKYGNSSDAFYKHYPEMYEANSKKGGTIGDAMTAIQICIDVYHTTLQAKTIDAFTEAHIEYMENALKAIAPTGDMLALRTSLQTLIAETQMQYNNKWDPGIFCIDVPEWTGSIEVYLNQYKNLAFEETINIAAESIPGVGLAAILCIVPDIFTGDKADDLLTFKKTYELAVGSRDSLLSAIDSLKDPLTQDQVDDLMMKLAFYTGSCQTVSDAYNNALQYDEKKGLPISTSNYNGELFMEEAGAYINIFLRDGELD